MQANPTRPLGVLYLVATPRAGQPEPEFLARVEAALDGGVDTLQLRCKDWEAAPYIALGEKVRELAHARNIPFFINDRVDVAVAVGADGVHLGQNDLPVRWARELAPQLRVGRSTHRPEDAEAALREAPAYFAAGPVHATPTKPGRAAAGLEYVRHVAALTPPLPWYAIGGIDLHTLDAVLDAGATRVAVVRAVLDAPDPAQAAQALRVRLSANALAPLTATLHVNGTPHPHTPGLTLHALLHDLAISRERVAIAVNDDFHPGGQAPDRPLYAGDNVEIVRVIGGG
ncbi:thiamine phosphate synthase [Deinococcus cavernae]|uniref:Thiamine-phosphate synthase n=1 Tax=Deinococcus cavernae TaxID=2320857 RepID=A0A418V6F4_9DEIO|nr:thiamine phosphate synthase [Deinococcus cavernae]RJF71672.1 thiamine phosphate synthase [Deinococcus cavernae]